MSQRQASGGDSDRRATLTSEYDISVIIPVYNGEATIAEAIRSVRAQQSIVEIIVVDGGSEDDTLGKAVEAGVDTIISEKDDGVYDAMNKGIDKAQGEWLYFLGSDDKVEPDALDVLLRSPGENVKIVFGNVRNVGRTHKGVPEEIHCSLSSSILWKNTLHHQGTMYHRSLFSNYRYQPEFKILADYHLNILSWQNRTPFKYTDVLVARCDATGLSKSFPMNLYHEELRMKATLLSAPQMILQHVWVRMKFLFKKFSA